MNRKNADRLHKTIMAAISIIGDQQASEGVELFPKLKQDGSLVHAGTRVNWNGTLKRAAVDLWDSLENNPENAPALWEDVAYKLGHRIIQDVITSTLAFSKDEIGWWGDKLYKSLLEANVYTPEQYPAGWEEVTV